MNEEIIFKWDRESIGKCIWKSGLIKVEVTVYSSNSTKICWFYWRCSKVLYLSFDLSILISQSNKREFISNVNLIKKRCQMQ